MVGLVCLVNLSMAGALVYSTFLGGGDSEEGKAITIDSSNNVYITGRTYSSDFPTNVGVFDTTYSGVDAFVTKINANGTALLYSTFLGGSDYDEGYGIAVDPAGNAYISGRTASSDFPTIAGSFDSTYHSGEYGLDAFVSKLNSTGSGLIFSTYLGGSWDDNGSEGIAVDTAGNVYVTGYTHSATDFPITSNAFATTHNGGWDVFVTKFNAAGSILLYSTFLGGPWDDSGYNLAIDNSGNAYIIGSASSNFPTTTGAFQTSLNGNIDVFVSKLNTLASGTASLVYSTYLGGSDIDSGNDIKVDDSGNAYITGDTWSSDFPTTVGAVAPSFNGGSDDCFVSKINTLASGTASLVYSTYLGGNNTDYGYGLALDRFGNTYITGYAQSTNFPVTIGAYDISVYSSRTDTFISVLDATGSSFLYSTFLGGSDWDIGFDIAVDNDGDAYITGFTVSSDFPTTIGAFDTTYSGGYFDAFVTKLRPYPGIERVSYNDVNLNDLIDAGDTLTVQFPRPMRVNSSSTSSFYLPVTGDTFGSGATVSLNTVLNTQVLITLGSSPVLTIPGLFSINTTSSSSPSGLDISASMPSDAIEDVNGLDARDGGVRWVNDSGVDIKPTLIPSSKTIAPGFQFTYAEETVSVVVQTEGSGFTATYTKHRLIVPSGSLKSISTFTVGNAGDNHGRLSAVAFGPADLTFSKDTPCRLVLQYQPWDINTSEGYIASSMRIHQWNPNTQRYELIPETYGPQVVDPIAGTVSVNIDKFDMLGVGGGSLKSFASNTTIVYANIALPTVGAKTATVTPAALKGLFADEAEVSFIASTSMTISVTTAGTYKKHKLTLLDYTPAYSGITVTLSQPTYNETQGWPPDQNPDMMPNNAIMKISVTGGIITTQAVLTMEYKDYDDPNNQITNDVRGGDESQMRLYRWVNGWSKINTAPQTIDRYANTVTVTLDSLTVSERYGVAIDASEPASPLSYLNSYGSFSTSGDLDTTHWMFESYGGSSSGTLSWVTGYAGRTGVAQLSQNTGERAQLSQLFSVPSSGWYTASARVATDISDPIKQQKVYLYLQELSASTAIVATGNVIIQPGKGGFGGAGNWQELKISFYSNATFMGVQVVGINKPKEVSGVPGNLYIDDVWVVAGASQPSGTVTLTNPDFTTDTSGWGLEVYGGAPSGSGTWSWDGSNVGGHIGVLSGYQSAGQKGQLTQNVDLPYGSDDALCSVWVYSGAGSMSGTQKVYLYLYSLSNNTIVVSGNAILQPGGWAQGVWRELQFGYPPLTGYNSVQLVGINKPPNPTQYIYFDTVSVKQD
jgi:hypothetical protein